MNAPKTKNLKLDEPMTRKIRQAMSGARAVKITINIDAETLAKVREEADRIGIPYQRLINRKLRESAGSTESDSARLDRLEKEIDEIRRVIRPGRKIG
jgi:predicted DNA binding CopG/RHH family protein